MFKVQSLIEKELELERNVEENNRAVCELVAYIEELSKKKADDIRFVLCADHV